MSSLKITYTSVYFDSETWGFQWVSDDELEAPEVASQSPRQAPPSLDYVPGPEHPPLPDYVPGPEEPEQAPLSPDYVPEPEYPEYLVSSDAEAPIEDQPLPDDASPIALSSGYVVDSDPEEDPEEDPDEYPADGGDEDGDDDDDDDKEEEEHLAPADSNGLHTVNPVSLAEDTEAFMTDEYAPTPPSPRSRRARISIPSPPLPLPSTPTHTSPTYAEAPLGYRAAGIWLRAASLSTHHPLDIALPPLLLPSTSHIDDTPEEDILLRKRARFTALTSRFKVGESSAAAGARQLVLDVAMVDATPGCIVSGEVGYRIEDVWDDIVRDMEERAPTTIKGLSQRVTDLSTTLA
ncbi:hypothetical protein Tco_1443837 [Tanacetum coccineum]